jgi:hypothetical protein
MIDVSKMIHENSLRNAVLDAPYDPILGIGSPIERAQLKYDDYGNEVNINIPVSMFNEPLISLLQKYGSLSTLLKNAKIEESQQNIFQFKKGIIDTRFRYDFEYWAYTTNRIQDKDSKKPIPFKLNFAQRILLNVLEKLRMSGTPIRIVLAKARQWGGSTLVQSYFFWIQNILVESWHSLIVGDVEEQSRKVRGMYNKIAKQYPSDIGTITTGPYLGSTKNIIIKERNCVISIGSVQKPETLRGDDAALLHLTEVGSWKTTLGKSPEDLAQTLSALIPYVPLTMIVKESTAKGVGNYFHNEYRAAKNKESGYTAVFVPFFKIPRDRMPISDYESFIKTMSEHDMYMWNLGASLESINWWNFTKRSESMDDWRMNSENPPSDNDAFQSSDRRAFNPDYVQRNRKNCRPPDLIGEIFSDSTKGDKALNNIVFKELPNGKAFMWMPPDKSIKCSNRYVVICDIGGRTNKADKSTIRVLDRYWMAEGGRQEFVFTWIGNEDQDTFAWRAVKVAKLYNNALFVVEFNSLDTDAPEGGDHFITVLNEIVKYYDNIYYRSSPEDIRQGRPVKYGFHTNKSTKPAIIDGLNGDLRDENYIETDERVLDECDTYELKQNGTYGAVDGCYDDLVMTTAIGLFVSNNMEPPTVSDGTKKYTRKKIVSEATI